MFFKNCQIDFNNMGRVIVADPNDFCADPDP